MQPYDLVRSILARAHVPYSHEHGSQEALPDPGPPVPTPVPPDVYDPVFATYEDASPAYQPPEPWFEGMPITGTPPPARVRDVEARVEPDQVRYDHAPMDQALFNALMRAAIDEIAAQGSPLAAENPAPDALPDPYSAPETVQPEPDPVAVANAVFDHQMQVVSAMAEPPAPEQLEPSTPLEQMVEQEFQQMMDASMPMDPFGPIGPDMGPII